IRIYFIIYSFGEQNWLIIITIFEFWIKATVGWPGTSSIFSMPGSDQEWRTHDGFQHLNRHLLIISKINRMVRTFY
ncbi:MAG: hypothetical protein WBB35_05830, partial [Saprospiraceae bacterium]